MRVPIVINRRSPLPLHRQIYEHWRDGILAARSRGGDKAPSTRELADTLKLSRATITAAYDQLIAEGYFDATHGAGTFVCRELPDVPIARSRIAKPSAVPRTRRATVHLSQYARRLQSDQPRPPAPGPGVVD